MLKVHLKQSKIDQFRIGVDVVVWKTRDPYCPIMAVLKI